MNINDVLFAFLFALNSNTSQIPNYGPISVSTIFFKEENNFKYFNKNEVYELANDQAFEKEIFQSFINKLLGNQINIDSECLKVLDDNFWDLLL